MLATEVDDDFFTPVAGTSLANIFANVSKNRDETENDSLKYVAPKAQNIPRKNEQKKATECILACALVAHEWCNNVYTSRGKLGFAIVKIQKTGEHNLILYDSNKSTLSSTCISTSLSVTVKNNSYISYYDSVQKYWSIYGTAEEIKKICDILESLEVNISYSTYLHKGPPEPNKLESEEHANFKESVQYRESDTDSSVNRKTKATILNRMASMGHSVLPTRPSIGDSSESSDTIETDVQPMIRHKPSKTIKKNAIETLISESQNLTITPRRITTPKTESENVTIYNGQLLPITNTSVIASTSNELGMFMSEQRISNSELRINLNRITDKVDSVLNKINNLEHKGKNTDISTDILLKLLTEYENKIKVYEELLKAKGDSDKKIIVDQSVLAEDKQIEILNRKLSEMLEENDKKHCKIAELEYEIKLLKEKHAHEIQNKAREEIELHTKIDSLENGLMIKDKEITVLTENISTATNSNIDYINSKVKNIMNDTFQSISVNFENSESYTGETVKRIIGTVIKKNTINSLCEFLP